MVSTAGGRRLSDEELDILLAETEGAKGSEVRTPHLRAKPASDGREKNSTVVPRGAEKSRLQVCVAFKSNVHLEM